MPQARAFEIADNSFLVEEAFNQEPGIGSGRTDVSVFGYFSYELPFLKKP